MKLPSLFLISGWAHTEAALEELATLLNAYFSVTIVSPHHLRDETPESNSSYITGLLELLKKTPDKPIIAGWSMGAMIALETAALNPDTIKALALISATARFCRKKNDVIKDKSTPSGIPEPAVRAMSLNLKKDRESTLLRFFEQTNAPERPSKTVIEKRLFETSLINDAELNYGLEYLRKFDIRERLSTIIKPTLILHGKRDEIVPWEAARFLESNLPNAKLVSDEKSGHSLPTRNPYFLASEIIRRFAN